MKLVVKNPHLFVKSATLLSTLIRIILTLLLFIVVAAMLVSVYKAGSELWHDIHEPSEVILRHILLEAVFMLALVEIAITILAYLRDGSVHVRYIVDTILIIMLNEVVTTWFTHPSFEKSASLALIIATLAAVRVSVTKLAPISVGPVATTATKKPKQKPRKKL